VNYFKKKIGSLKKRYRFAKYGILYLRDGNIIIGETLRINGKFRNFKFADPSNDEFTYEFTEICINDCYHLADLNKMIPDVRVVVDIGANQGIFAIAARQQFAHASITCYEPNKILEPALSHNAGLINAKVFYEAASSVDCKMILNMGKSDLHSKTEQSENGDVTGTSFSGIIQRAGGEIDILKMDCEGAEWELFENVGLWKKVKAVTMEYHLWAKIGRKVEDIITILNSFGLAIISRNRLAEEFGLITAVRLT
jgi:FkbM family methyltransferase